MARLLTPWADHLDIEGRSFDSYPEDGGHRFPDDEVYVRLDGVDDLDQATIVHSGWEPNAGLVFLEAAVELLREHDVAVDVVFAYMPYARQDTEHHGGDLNQAQAIVRRLTEYHAVRRIHALDPHCAGQDWVQEYPFQPISAVDRLLGAVDLDDPIIVGPDLGAADRFGIEGFRKQRRSARSVSVSGDLDVAGRDVVVLDDMIATGGTLCAAHDRLRDQGANQIVAAAVHGVLEEGITRVRQEYDDVYLTDSMPNEAANVSVGQHLMDCAGDGTV